MYFTYTVHEPDFLKLQTATACIFITLNSFII